MVQFLRVSWLAVLALAVCLTAVGVAQAIQPTVVQIEKNNDDTYTYHFKIKIDDAVTRAIQFSERGCKSSLKRVKGFWSTWGFA